MVEAHDVPHRPLVPRQNVYTECVVPQQRLRPLDSLLPPSLHRQYEAGHSQPASVLRVELVEAQPLLHLS